MNSSNPSVRLGRRFVLPLAALSVIAVGGCAGDKRAPGVATAETVAAKPTQSGPAAGTVARYVEAQRAYVGCMRSHGVPDLPDPGPDGAIDFGDLGKRKADNAFTAASETCKTLRVPVPDELKQKVKRTPEQLAAAREYAKCMRANGAVDFQDPPADGTSGRQPQPDGQQASVWLRAGQICEPVLKGMPPATAVPPNTGVG